MSFGIDGLQGFVEFLDLNLGGYHSTTELDDSVVIVFRGVAAGNHKEFFEAKLQRDQSLKEWLMSIANAIDQLEDFQEGSWKERLR